MFEGAEHREQREGEEQARREMLEDAWYAAPRSAARTRAGRRLLAAGRSGALGEVHLTAVA